MEAQLHTSIYPTPRDSIGQHLWITGMASSRKRRKLGDFADRRTTSEPRQPVTLLSLGLSGVLPRGITEQGGLPCFPCRPAQLPVNPSETLLVEGLKRLNGHPRDKHITFEAGDHAYFWKGDRVTRSVTQLVHEFKNEFSEDHVISTMQTSTNWPRPDYLKSTLSEHQEAELAGLKDTEQLLMEFQRKERDELRICKLTHQLRARAPKNRAIAEMVTGLGLSEAEIREKWAKARDDGAKEGMWMHAQFECLLNGGSLPCQTAEVVLLTRFLRSQRDTIAYRTEWQVYADDLRSRTTRRQQSHSGLETYQKSTTERRGFRKAHARTAMRRARLHPLALPPSIERIQVHSRKVLRANRLVYVHSGHQPRQWRAAVCRRSATAKARDRRAHATLDDPQASRIIESRAVMVKCRQAQLFTVGVFQCRHLRRAEPARAPEFSICQHLANASFKSIIQHQPQETEVHCASDQPATDPPHASFRTRAPSRLGRTAARSRSCCAMALPANAAGSLPLQWDDERLRHVQDGIGTRPLVMREKRHGLAQPVSI